MDDDLINLGAVNIGFGLMAVKTHVTDEANTERFQMRVSPEFLATIDAWRRKQPDLPSRAEAIRRLVEQALRGKK